MLDISLGNLLAWALQVAALVVAGVVLPGLLRMTSPRPRLAYLRAVLVICLALPLLQPWAPARPRPLPTVMTDLAVGIAPASTIDNATAAGADATAGRGDGRSWPDWRTWPWGSVAVAVFVAGLALRLAWLALGLASLARLRRSSVPLDPRPESVDDAALMVGADADFRVSSRVVRPVTFGLRRPVVLVPPDFSAFTPTQQTAVAAHELLHVARRDWVRTLGDEVILSVLWFHPALWWLVDQIHLHVEQVVDRDVVRVVGARKPYLEALLKLAAAGPTPMLQPASLFLKHGHLAQRVALLVREVSMSRIRLVCSFVVVVAVLAAGGWFVVQAVPLRAAAGAAALPAVPLEAAVVASPMAQATNALLPPPSPPPPPQQPTPVVDQKVQAAKPGALPVIDGSLSSYVALARRYEEAGDLKNAEKTYLELTKARPKDPGAFLNLAGYYNRRGDFEKTVAALTQRVAIEPSNPEGPYTIATYYWDKAYRDQTLDTAQKRELVAKGMDQVDRAIQIKPDYMEALTYKNLLLRLQASVEPDPATQQALLAEADKLRDQAIKIRDAQNAWDAVPANAIRVGGGIAAPKKIKNVAPVYPPDALSARSAGVVIVEAVISPEGSVAKTRVLRRRRPRAWPAVWQAGSPAASRAAQPGV
jgi:beta-lactamase regulating signal transducer with metallopeptidase domain